MLRQSILVVDDEAPMRKLVASNLSTSGYDVCTAADGTEALKLIQEQSWTSCFSTSACLVQTGCSCSKRCAAIYQRLL